MEKGLERATGEEALGSRVRSQQQAAPAPSSVGQEPGSSRRDYPAGLTSFPLCSLCSPAAIPATKFLAVRGVLHATVPHPASRAASWQQHAKATRYFHREQTHRSGGWRAETHHTPTAAAKWVDLSQFAREVFKNAENSPGTEFPALSTQASYLLQVCIWAKLVGV